MILLAALALAAAPAADLAYSDGTVDGHEFVQKEWNRPEVTVGLRLYPDQAALDAAYLRIKGKAVPAGGHLNAFTELDPTDPVCIIHLVDPAVLFKPASLGHEVMHCAFGRWHR